MPVPRPSRRQLLHGAAALALTGCRRAAGGPLHVLVAASLAEVMAAILTDFAERRGEATPDLVADASSRLATQIRAGAPADVFISADLAWMDALADDGLVLDDTRHALLGNRLVVVTPRDAPWVPADASALATATRLALAGGAVPAGRYARAALTSLGIADALSARIVEADDVRTALAWVARGEAPAGIGYATDAAIEPAVRVAFAIPESSHPPIVYPIAALRDAGQPAAARAFVEHCRSASAADRFRAAGFTVL